MNIKKMIKSVINKSNGIVKASDFLDNGISSNDILHYCNEGYIYRVRHGYYSLSNSIPSLDEQIITKLIPQGIICLESALYYYGYCDFTPRKWSLAVPRSISRTRFKVDSLSLKIYYVQSDIYMLGKTFLNINGTILPIYDRERTICDCFKFRSKLDSETFNKAVHAYANDKNKNLNNLATYAKKLRVYKKVMELMEVLINE